MQRSTAFFSYKKLFFSKIFKSNHVYFSYTNSLTNKSKLLFGNTSSTSQYQPSQDITIQSLRELSINFQYTEQAYTPLEISQMVRADLSKKSKQDIMHQFFLFHKKIVPFDYDFFQEGLLQLIKFQRVLKIQQIVVIFQLSQQYKIQNPIIHQHIQNQLYLRMYQTLNKELLAYDQELDNKKNKMLQSLQDKSQDYFHMIQEEFKQKFQQPQNEKQQNQQQNQQENQQNLAQSNMDIIQFQKLSPQLRSRPIHNKNKKTILFATTQLQQISKIVLNSNSKNSQFLKLLLESLTIRSQKQIVNCDFLFTYTKLTLKILQNYMESFTKNTKQYTKRSIKRIYNLQTMYYFQIVKFIEQKKLLQQMNKQQFISVVDLISSFPIKRRYIRKQLGIAFIQKCKQQGIQFIVLEKFFKLNRNDNRLLLNFQKMIQQAEVSNVKMLQDNQENSNSIQVYKIDAKLFRQVKPKKKRVRKQNSQKKYVEIDLTGQGQGQIAQNKQLGTSPK